MRKIVFIFVLLLATSAWAQPPYAGLGNMVFLRGTSDPVGTCVIGTEYLRTDTETRFSCIDGSWSELLTSVGGLSFPLSAPNGSRSAPQYGWTTESTMGSWFIPAGTAKTWGTSYQSGQDYRTPQVTFGTKAGDAFSGNVSGGAVGTSGYFSVSGMSFTSAYILGGNWFQEMDGTLASGKYATIVGERAQALSNIANSSTNFVYVQGTTAQAYQWTNATGKHILIAGFFDASGVGNGDATNQVVALKTQVAAPATYANEYIASLHITGCPNSSNCGDDIDTAYKIKTDYYGRNVIGQPLDATGDAQAGLEVPGGSGILIQGRTGQLQLTTASGGSQPTCDATTRGSLWFTNSGAAVADTIEVCAKNSSDTYAWYDLVTVP